MIRELKEIASLQPKWSNKNTPEMRRRGIIIRKEMPAALRSHWSEFAAAIPRYFEDLNVEGSDGKGQKTQAPWIRIHSKLLSPSATNGFYLVIHFSVDGRYIFVTLGCGATRWDSERGDLVSYSDGEVAAKVKWALARLKENGSTTADFPDEIAIGSSHKLPRSFEKATILCKTFSTEQLSEADFINAVINGLRLLSTVYDRCSELSDLPESEIAKSEIEALLNPSKKKRGARQGYGLTGPERKAVELRAMAITKEYLADKGFKTKDTSSKYPFDFLATKGSESVKVEVKGTTSRFVDSIMMTSNEVDLHSREVGETALAIVSGIEFIERGQNARCRGGVIEFIHPWDINDWTMEPKAYLVARRT